MLDSGNPQSMLRSTLIAVGAMLGASVVFVATSTLVLVLIADRALSPSTTSKVGDSAVATSTATAATTTTTVKPAVPAAKTGGGRS